MPLRPWGEESDMNARPAPYACSCGPRPPRSGCREISTTGMPSQMGLACLVIRTPDPFSHASRDNAGEKPVALIFAGFRGYMLKFDFMISSNILLCLIQ